MNPLASLTLKLFFEVSDSAMFGGVGTKGYSMVSLNVNEKIMEYLDEIIIYQQELTTKIFGVSVNQVRLISEEEYDLMTEDEF